MSSKKISDLTEVSTPEAGDFLAIVSGGDTKKVQAGNLCKTVPDGSAAEPGLSFANDRDTGFYRIGADSVGLSSGGSEILRADSGLGYLYHNATGGFALNLDVDSAGAPPYTFAGDTDTGWRRPAADAQAWVNGGVEGMRLNSTGLALNGSPVSGYLLTLKEGTSSAAARFLDSDSAVMGTIGFARATDDIVSGSANLDLVIHNYQAANILFAPNHTIKARLNAAGNFGLGVTPKSWHADYTAFQLGGLGGMFTQKTAAASNTYYFTNNAYFDGSWKHIVNDEVSYFSQANGSFTFGAGAAGAADSAISWETLATFNLNGACTFYYDNAAKLATFGQGVAIGGVTPETWYTGLAAIQIGGYGAIFTETATGVGVEFAFAQNIYKNAAGARNYIVSDEAAMITMNSGVISLLGGPAGTADTTAYMENMLTAAVNGAVTLYYNNVAKLATTSGGVAIASDSDKLYLGASNDIELYHNGTSSSLVNNTGIMYITTAAALTLRTQSDAAITLTHNGNVAMATSGNGQITVGVEDTQYGVVTIAGHGPSSIVGGVAILKTAADHDTTIDGFYLQARENNFWLGPSTDGDALTYLGTTNHFAFSAANGLVLDVARSSAPASPQTTAVYCADGVSWDPLGRSAGKPYLVFYDGTTYTEP